MQYIQKNLLSFSGVITLAFLCFYFKFDIIKYISDNSGFFISLLTFFYVLTTSKQLNVMQHQLKIKSQPFPYLEKIQFEIEEPRFFYTPPEDEYSYFTRYFINGVINNLTDEPAISLYISSKIKLNNQSILSFDDKLDVVEGKTKTSKISLMVNDDKGAILFNALREHQDIELEIKLLYKSISGGCFLQKNIYQLCFKDEDKDKIINWHTNISVFPTKYKEKLKELKKLRRKNAEWENLFQQIKEESQESILKDPLNLICFQTNSLKNYSISESDYKKETLIDNYREKLFSKNFKLLTLFKIVKLF